MKHFLLSLLFIFQYMICVAQNAEVRTRSTQKSPFKTIEQPALSSKLRANKSALDLNDKMCIECFDDVKYEVTFDPAKTHQFGQKSQQGKSQNSDLYNVTYIKNGAEVYCLINDFNLNTQYSIISNDGIHFTITQEDKSKQTRKMASPLKTPHTSNYTNPTTFSAVSNVNDTQKNYIDIMITYDRTILKWLKEKELSIQNFSTSYIAQSNQYLRNSGINSFEFRLAAIVPTSLHFDDFFKNYKRDVTIDRYTKILTLLVENKSEEAQAINKARELYGADIVCNLVFANEFGYVGLSYALENYNHLPEFSKYAYCVISASKNAEVFAHEIGHIMGAGHSRDQSSAPGPQLFYDSSGFYLKGKTRGHTLMAYNFDGIQTYTSLPLFSNITTPHYKEKVGSSLDNNAKTLILTAPSVSKFKKETTFNDKIIYSASVGSYDNKIIFSWQKPTGVKYFQLFDEIGTLITKTTNKSYTLKTTNSNPFTYKLIAYDLNNNEINPAFTATGITALQFNEPWVSDSHIAWNGAVFNFLNTALPIKGMILNKSPSFQARYIDPFTQKEKKVALKLLTNPSKATPLRDFSIEFSAKIQRINRRLAQQAYKENQSITTRLDSTIQPQLFAYLFMKYNFTPFHTQTSSKFEIMQPEITQYTRSFDSKTKKDIFNLNGRYFGAKKPKVYLEYTSNGKIKKRTLSVISKPIYPNFAGTPNKLFTHPITGISQVSLSCKIKPELETPLNLIIDNGSSLASIKL